MRVTIMLLTAILSILLLAGHAGATFSIVAVDTVNGVVGGAGASCIDNAQIINDIIDSIGAVHTQAYWLQANQDNAHLLLNQGLTPDSIIGWLAANDYEGRPQKRQYGVVTFDGPGASASYTGSSNSTWAGHITGPGYAIQGNILLGPEIVQDMETAFLTTDGPLEQKLMAALEAAKVVGADTRCQSLDKSSISAFIRVKKSGDGNSYFLNEVVPNTTGSTDPIDILRTQFDTWQLAQSAHPDSSEVTSDREYLEADGSATAQLTITPRNWSGETPEPVDSVLVSNIGDGSLSDVLDNGDGTYSVTITAPTAAPGTDQFSVQVSAYYGILSSLSDQPELTYYLCGDIDQSLAINVSDLTFLVDYLFRNGPVPLILAATDINGDSELNVSDLTAMVSYVFNSGAAPICE